MEIDIKKLKFNKFNNGTLIDYMGCLNDFRGYQHHLLITMFCLLIKIFIFVVQICIPAYKTKNQYVTKVNSPVSFVN